MGRLAVFVKMNARTGIENFRAAVRSDHDPYGASPPGEVLFATATGPKNVRRLDPQVSDF
jgi:hypothetical protein